MCFIIENRDFIPIFFVFHSIISPHTSHCVCVKVFPVEVRLSNQNQYPPQESSMHTELSISEWSIAAVPIEKVLTSLENF